MARKKSRKKVPSGRARQALGILLFLSALVLLIALVSHNALDDRRIQGDGDINLDPFDIQYRNQAGMLGAYLSFVGIIMMGWLSFFLPLGFAISGLRLFAGDLSQRLRFFATLLFGVGLLGTMIFNLHLLVKRSLVTNDSAIGGYIGEKLSLLSIRVVGELGSYVLLGGLIVLLLVLHTSISGLFAVRVNLPGGAVLGRLARSTGTAIGRMFSFRWLAGMIPTRKAGDADQLDDSGFADELENQIEADADSDIDDEAAQEKPMGTNQLPRKPRESRPKKAKQVQVSSMEYKYPGIDLLSENPHPGSAVSDEELAFTARMLGETLETFGVKIEGQIERFPGPVITRYEFKPGTGIKVNQILNLSDDLALALKAKRIRIIAPIPGKAAVGIEIPNRQAHTVYLRDVIDSPAFNDAKPILPLALGLTTAGKPYVTDLAKLPHLLIAGATGSGKSVCINVIITSLMYRLHPHQVRFIMIDPKMLELTLYSGIPHLGRPVVTNPKRAEKVLADAVVEMEGRYRKLANASVRNIEDFNKKQKGPEDQLPYIVIMVDELADLLMSTNSSKTELLITRLAQMARAVGIHLILATQRPSVDVITGLIKANFPARIAFQVSQKVDSRTIIDANGAEKLLGNGDMLFLHPGQPEATRLHGAFLRNEETDSIVAFIKDQGLPMLALENISQASGETTEAEVDFGDPLFREACEVVVRHRQGSVSLLQRRLGIGYQRAARLIDKLEQAGIVSTFDGSKARDVLVDQTYIDTLFQKAGQVPVGGGDSK